jgi:hypothetical protein
MVETKMSDMGRLNIKRARKEGEMRRRGERNPPKF